VKWKEVFKGVLITVLSSAIIGTTIGVWKLAQLPRQIEILEDHIEELVGALNDHIQEEHN
jgi:hypothetical protein